MKIFGLLCVRNETTRWLDETLRWNSQFLDEIFVYDDQSTDDTVALARLHGCAVVVRDDWDFPFLEDEGRFRQAGYEAFEMYSGVEKGDWVLALDADEFLVADDDERDALEHLAAVASAGGSSATSFKVLEAFALEGATPLIRTDGFWDNIEALRFFEYHEGGRIPRRRLGCGSVPHNVSPNGVASNARILHYGYVRPEDRRVKHERYRSIVNNGHSSKHIDSIITPAALVPYRGKVPVS